jgi:hypothetical protein
VHVIDPVLPYDEETEGIDDPTAEAIEEHGAYCGTCGRRLTVDEDGLVLHDD